MMKKQEVIFVGEQKKPTMKNKFFTDEYIKQTLKESVEKSKII